MSWIDQVTFDNKEEPLTEAELEHAKGFLSKPLTENEIEALEDLCRVTGEIDFRCWELPDYILPNEYIDLLKYSRSGLLRKGERELGFFGIEEIRDYYLRYMFPEYQPGAIPIGFNGGGVFYAYDLRNIELGAPIIAVSSGALDWEDSIVLGRTLEEVFSKKTNIEDEM
ncbi:SMI1/KNR4 family protein [Thalassolituus alkanivorans]|uniref:SMI1/KNR4 family protein n=1 Tax=Thalassolituus alkanivorans TaxID=2881055 RepID=UPI001E486F57|nr:SMI1/KNR4 family protein [Thalassolituus alkanivorans]MCB2386461.1 SMI1/KNR4 family protein [Thalassolituus alkanivorans]MCB2424391.1 SMI1/KNR4 family protein [Thalassolituus alkanivorans]